ncbi:MAG TPA: DUF805 domain-containing protein [Xanthobacteraceae bacterium]|nr:DUF805 domain-containing protein [Xanthobacteraceae bacterium]
MGFSQAIRSGFANYVNFAGRAVRSEYWYWVLFVALVGVAALLLDSAFIANRHGPFQAVWHLVTLLPGIAVAVRRLHDTDRSGWWLAAVFAATAALAAVFVFVLRSPILPMAIIVIGALVLIWWFCQPGTRGPNSYGPDPFGAAGHLSPPPAA